jgi:hypothetical protein
MITPTANDVYADEVVIGRVRNLIPIVEWPDMVEAWQKAEAALVPVRNRFDAAEQRWLTARTDPSAVAELDQATCCHESQLDLCGAALDALLDTKAPDLSVVLWKLEIVANRLGPDMPADLRFLVPDLRAVEAIHAAQMTGGDHAGA